MSSRERVLKLRAEGLSLTRIARELGLQRSTAAYYGVANLQLLCPNCHSQTDNFAGRNKRLRSAA